MQDCGLNFVIKHKGFAAFMNWFKGQHVRWKKRDYPDYKYTKCFRLYIFNPISAGVIENQDMQGGGSILPSKSHVWCPNMTNDTSLESSCALLESAKNLQICKTWISYRKIQLYIKCLQKKICPKKEKLYIFEKALTMPFQICKNLCKILKNLIFNQEKLKMCKFP